MDWAGAIVETNDVENVNTAVKQYLSHPVNTYTEYYCQNNNSPVNTSLAGILAYSLFLCNNFINAFKIIIKYYSDILRSDFYVIIQETQNAHKITA